MSIKFDNQELIGSTYIPRFVKHESNPDRELNSAELSGEDGSVFISTRWGKKIIKTSTAAVTSISLLKNKLYILIAYLLYKFSSIIGCII